MSASVSISSIASPLASLTSTQIKKLESTTGFNFKGHTVKVFDHTIDNLKLAQKAIWAAKALLPYGAGNQIVDVYKTQGESAARVEFMRKEEKKLSVPGHAQQAMRVGAGNCGEHSAMTFSLLAAEPHKAPISWVSERGIDHAYVVIGDPRDPDYGEKNTVVADAWPTFGVAHTLAEGLFKTPEVKETQPPGSGDKDYQLKSRSPLGSTIINRELPAGKPLLMYLAQAHQEKDILYQQWFSATDPTTQYQNENATDKKVFNQQPHGWVEQKLNQYEKAEKEGFPDSY
ncbi:hypothetical protein H0A36_10525 [Endozoicomonas sp. SM1973]|uniref:Uncharacterized protein n=1 Tax=Spartinivicinus marinus TaxID=2994442 RepID=A0A853I8N6_9GAMM|nr:hypothetical protein [Spartinivicinus marinus]MCX4024911.1 hypothetical protein [Spartinivicinus marinus]NYZ66444.1 hypothetical protein [Spartinivicinus marinus]